MIIISMILKTDRFMLWVTKSPVLVTDMPAVSAHHVPSSWTIYRVALAWERSFDRWTFS